MDETMLHEIEIDLLLHAIEMRYGFNFKQYKRASLTRSLNRIVSKQNLNSISDLIPLIFKDENIFNEILCDISIPVSDMFRDPMVFLALRQHVIPILKTYPFIKVWHAGCASGEEVYSFAILLQEEGLYERSRIYGTDINLKAIARAKEGIYSASKLAEYNENYLKAGGKSNLADYFNIKYDSMIINSDLRKNIFFFAHNLASDQVFGEMHLILCRNVIIYFDTDLQAKVISLFEQSLCYGGFLCLGTKEALDYIKSPGNIFPWLKKEKIFKKCTSSTEVPINE